MKHFTLLSLVAAALLFTACGEKTKEAATDVANAVTEAVKSDTTSAVEATKQAVADAANAAKDKAAELAVSAKAEADKMAEAAVKKAAELKATAEAKAAAALKERAVAATEAVSVSPASPEAYTKCKGCHGADGKTKALGKSAVIAGQSKEAIIASMNAYKAGTKNVVGMGLLMKGQAVSMSDADIEAVADYLSQL